jgi:hypothetical protein
MSKTQLSASFFVSLVVVILGAILVIGAAGYIIFHSSSKKPTETKTLTSASAKITPAKNKAYAVLTPASVPSKTAECSTPISYDSSGASGPVQCSNGDLNILEWQAVAALEPRILSLGYNVTLQQVEATVCLDIETNSVPLIEKTAYQIAALYYGWNFPSNPTAAITSNTYSC